MLFSRTQNILEKNDMEFFILEDIENKVLVPLFSDSVRAGFPSPAEDFVERKLDLNQYIIKSPASTFFVRVQGDSMIDLGIANGDLLVVDKSIEVKNNDIVIASVDGGITVKVFIKDSKGIWLVPANRKYKPLLINESKDLEIWGVVISCVKKFL